MVGKSKGFFRIIKKSGKYYVIKVETKWEGNKVRQKFLAHIGVLEDIQKAICGVQK